MADGIVYYVCGWALAAGLHAFRVLRVAGEKEWERYQREQAWLRLRRSFQILAEAFAEFGVAIRRAGEATRKLGEQMREIAP